MTRAVLPPLVSVDGHDVKEDERRIATVRIVRENAHVFLSVDLIGRRQHKSWETITNVELEPRDARRIAYALLLAAEES